MYKNRKKNYPYYDVRPCTDMRNLLDESARLFGDRPCIKYKEKNEVKTVSYTEFKAEVDAFGTALYSLGVGKSRIAIIGENSYSWILSYLTVLNSDGVVVPIDKDLPNADTAYILNCSECEAVIFSASVADKIDAIKAELPCLKFLIKMNGNSVEGNGQYMLRDLVDSGVRLLAEGDTSFLSVVPDTEGLKQLMFTSGTTGSSKGVMLSQGTLAFNVQRAQELMLITERCLSVLPYHHSYEATCGVLTMLHHGMTICINESLRALMNNFKLYKPTEMLVVPLYIETFYRRIWAAIEEKGKTATVKKGIKLSNALLKLGIDKRRKIFDEIHQTFGGELKAIICGGAPLKPYMVEFFESIGITLINGYGITECGPLISINRNEYHNPASVGLPLRDTEIRIDNPNENGEGEICVKGPNVMLGYFKNQAATDAAIVDGWFHTGDIGKIDMDGFVYITGRCKNLIVLKNGKNIYPEEIEEFLSEIPLIKEVVVYAAKLSGDAGKALGAEIFPDFEKAKELNVIDVEGDIKRAIYGYNEKQPPYKAIKQIVFRKEEFEKTTSKKIKRNYDR